jgi:hypothetical protein
MSSKKNNTIQENFEDAKGVIRSKLKEGQCNGQKKKDKRTSNDLFRISVCESNIFSMPI